MPHELRERALTTVRSALSRPCRQQATGRESSGALACGLSRDGGGEIVCGSTATTHGDHRPSGADALLDVGPCDLAAVDERGGNRSAIGDGPGRRRERGILVAPARALDEENMRVVRLEPHRLVTGAAPRPRASEYPRGWSVCACQTSWTRCMAQACRGDAVPYSAVK